MIKILHMHWHVAIVRDIRAHKGELFLQLVSKGELFLQLVSKTISLKQIRNTQPHVRHAQSDFTRLVELSLIYQCPSIYLIEALLHAAHGVVPL